LDLLQLPPEARHSFAQVRPDADSSRLPRNTSVARSQLLRLRVRDSLVQLQLVGPIPYRRLS
jgi:hypothetical protein